MGTSWQNPNFEHDRRRRRSLVVVVSIPLAAIAAAAFWTLLRPAADEVGVPAAALTSARPAAATGATQDDPLNAFAAKPATGVPDTLPPGDGASFDATAAQQPAATGGAGDFAALKALALSLYRQNELQASLEQVQAALVLQRDDELLELGARIKKEILVQRNYDDARTANFVVLFDGYEHEEMKSAVLDILKDAYAEIGKELDYFPVEPISVILYTGKDFSDVTHAPGWVGGMFGKVDGKIRVPVQGAEGQERTLRRVLTHEYVHALLHSMAANIPLWLHEGLAQHLSGDEAVSIGQLIPLGALMNGFPRDARPAYVAYMESLQAVQDLVDEYGMPRLRRLLGGLGAGKGLEAAFAAAYGQPFSRWATEWRPVERGEVKAAEPEQEEEDE